MFIQLKNKLHKLLYRILIIQTFILNKKNLRTNSYDKNFAEIKIFTDKGEISFIFKEERRSDFKYIKKYVVELHIPDELLNKVEKFNDKLIVVVKLSITKLNYKLLAEVLYEQYINNIIKQTN